MESALYEPMPSACAISLPPPGPMHTKGGRRRAESTRGAACFVALVVAVGGCVERGATFTPSPIAQDALPSHWLEPWGDLLRWQPREPRRAQAERALRERCEA